MKCPYCNGDGFFVENDPNDIRYLDPIYECYDCGGTGTTQGESK